MPQICACLAYYSAKVHEVYLPSTFCCAYTLNHQKTRIPLISLTVWSGNCSAICACRMGLLFSLPYGIQARCGDMETDMTASEAWLQEGSPAAFLNFG